jgi:2-(1,2-epoxy-1,2-dihydrophenyl)acetyl-CoA isomerase
MGDDGQRHETIRVEHEGAVATVTLHRPERLNGITNRMMRELHEALHQLAGDPGVRVVVLTGAGRSFCPGADLRSYAAGEPDERLRPEWFDVTVLLHEMPAVTIAAVNGACAGAGMGWACACDLRVAADTAVFNTAFLAVAVAGDMALPWSLPRLVGAARARELLLFPGKLTADEAHRLGLVGQVVPADALAGEVAAMAARLAAASPAALRGLKANLLAAERLPLADFVALETERHLRISASEDTAEAFRAFVEKRAPVFRDA